VAMIVPTWLFISVNPHMLDEVALRSPNVVVLSVVTG
jgi:hypothetical protein